MIEAMAWYDWLGLCGVAMVLIAYAQLQLRRMDAHGVTFPLVNLIGSLLILLSLWFKPNLSAIVIEAAWAAISLFGLWSALRASRRPPQ